MKFGSLMPPFTYAYFFMEVNALLPYYLQQSIFFENADELHGLLQYVIFAACFI